MSLHDLLPDLSKTGHLPYFLAVLFGLVGLEVSAIHADGVEEPEKSYPRGFLMAGIIIFFSLLLSSLAIAIVVPSSELNVVAGLTQAFEYFFDAFGLFWMKPVIVFMIIFGGIACMSTWILGPTRALLVAAHHGNLPAIFGKMNEHNAPVTLLIIQLIVGSLLSLMFLLLPTVNSSYWFLSVITSQLAMVVYIMLFAAALKLKLHKPHVKRHYEVPGGVAGMSIITVLGITTCAGAILIGFIPPEGMMFDTTAFRFWIAVGMLASMLPLVFLYRRAK
jgi:amino acid transporter